MSIHKTEKSIKEKLTTNLNLACKLRATISGDSSRRTAVLSPFLHECICSEAALTPFIGVAVHYLEELSIIKTR